jgi:uncharacterized protein (TIGR02271 family)
MATDKKSRRLQELRHSDFELADGETKIKGWDVKIGDGEKIGDVDDLIFDIYSHKVRYVKVDLKGKLPDTESKDVLVPIGLAQLKNLTHTVHLYNVTADQLKSLPEYEKDEEISADTERKILEVFGGSAMAGSAMAGSSATDTTGENDFYMHEHFNDRNFYDTDANPDSSVDANSATAATSGSVSDRLPVDNMNNNLNRDDTDRSTLAEGEQRIDVVKENLEVGKREVETGGIRLRSRIVERPVQETIRLREESVNVERTPVNQVADATDFAEKEIEMREHAEVPVVAKEARIVEEISISKDVEQKDQVISDTVRETQVKVEDLAEHETSNRR